MAKDFSQDGAVGAGGPGQSTAPQPGAFGASPPPVASSPPPVASGTINYAPGGSGGGASFTPQAIPSAPAAPSGGGDLASGKPSFQTGNAPGGSSPGSNVPNITGGIFFDHGGAVPDDNGQSQQQDPMSAILQRSLGSVDQVLQQMYKSYGLSTGQDQQGGVQEGQQAGNMPMAPAGQSETGIPPQRPAPGKLPPTSNPFGKRAEGGIDTDGDDDGDTA